MYRTRKSGFTLVEILIVVIILGILAAIVIPQFTNASQDARKNSLTSQLQTVRSQLELEKLQNRDVVSTNLNTTTVSVEYLYIAFIRAYAGGDLIRRRLPFRESGRM